MRHDDLVERFRIDTGIFDGIPCSDGGHIRSVHITICITAFFNTGDIPEFIYDFIGCGYNGFVVLAIKLLCAKSCWF
jgi:hypothetical protein